MLWFLVWLPQGGWTFRNYEGCLPGAPNLGVSGHASDHIWQISMTTASGFNKTDSNIWAWGKNSAHTAFSPPLPPSLSDMLSSGGGGGDSICRSRKYFYLPNCRERERKRTACATFFSQLEQLGQYNLFSTGRLPHKFILPVHKFIKKNPAGKSIYIC